MFTQRHIRYVKRHYVSRHLLPVQNLEAAFPLARWKINLRWPSSGWRQIQTAQCNSLVLILMRLNLSILSRAVLGLRVPLFVSLWKHGELIDQIDILTLNFYIFPKSETRFCSEAKYTLVRIGKVIGDRLELLSSVNCLPCSCFLNSRKLSSFSWTLFLKFSDSEAKSLFHSSNSSLWPLENIKQYWEKKQKKTKNKRTNNNNKQKIQADLCLSKANRIYANKIFAIMSYVH